MAVPLESVSEVIETDSLVRLVWSPPQVVGLCLFHREVVPVVLLGALVSEAATEPGPGHEPAGTTEDPEEHTPGGHMRCVVLILRTDQGTWGVRIDSEKTTMSCESPEYQTPRSDPGGPVLVGVVRHGGVSHAILDAEATWRSLRSAVSRWSGMINESYPCSPLHSAEVPMAIGPEAKENIGKHEYCRG